MSTPTPTEALARSGNVAAAKLIADSEARAVLKQTAYLKAMVQDGTNAMKERDQLRAELATERARGERIRTALKDAISTYFGADKLVTAERIEAWQAALKEDAKSP